MTISRPSGCNVFASRFSDPATDRTMILQHCLDFLRHGHNASRLVLRSGRWRDDRDPLTLYSWKWSEVTGKYVGAPYWSVAAKRVYDDAHARFASQTAQQLEAHLSARRMGSNQLQHEHVFPRKDWVRLMTPRIRGVAMSAEELRSQFARYCLGCIVTRAEHREVDRRAGDPQNPWKRYRGTSIRLVDNPEWSDQHRCWIEEAGLIAR